MSRVITFSRTFPAYHPRAGEPTYFVEKLYKSILKPTDHVPITGIESGLSLFALADAQPKHHTIRAGHRWKVGDWFSPRVWSGKPYNSKMITIAPDIQVKKVFDFTIKAASKALPLDYDTDVVINHRFYTPVDPILYQLAQNDGLLLQDLFEWFQFPKPFDGQIICWNENIEY